VPKYHNIVPLMTHREIAEVLGVSPMTVVNDEKSALRKLRAHLLKEPTPCSNIYPYSKKS